MSGVDDSASIFGASTRLNVSVFSSVGSSGVSPTSKWSSSGGGISVSSLASNNGASPSLGAVAIFPSSNNTVDRTTTWPTTLEAHHTPLAATHSFTACQTSVG